MKVIRVPIDQIDGAGRTRPVDPTAVEDMARDIEARGQRQPIEVAKKAKGGWKLVSGGHRLAAVAALGWTEIHAVEVNGKRLELRRDEHLDNLTRNNLTMLERAVALADLREIYQALHPETKRGGNRQNPNLETYQSAKMAFCSAVIARSEKGKRTIYRAAEIGQRLSLASVARLRGTDFENHQGELEAISKQPPERQTAVLDLLFQPDDPARTVAEALARLDGRTAVDADRKRLSAMVDRWGRMPKIERRSFVMSLADDQVNELAELIAQRVARGEEAA